MFGPWRREGSARRSGLKHHLAALRQCQARVCSVMCSCGLHFVCCIMGLRPGDAWVMSGEVHILILSCGDTSGEVRMFRTHT